MSFPVPVFAKPWSDFSTEMTDSHYSDCKCWVEPWIFIKKSVVKLRHHRCNFCQKLELLENDLIISLKITYLSERNFVLNEKILKVSKPNKVAQHSKSEIKFGLIFLVSTWVLLN